MVESVPKQTSTKQSG